MMIIIIIEKFLRDLFLREAEKKNWLPFNFSFFNFIFC